MEARIMATDHVCGEGVYKKVANAGYSYQGHIYYFCGSDCKDKFAKAPEKYVDHSNCIS